MIIKDNNLDCIDIECWNLDKEYEEYLEGINDAILINCRTWDGEKIKEYVLLENMNLEDGFLLQRILSEWGYLNVTVAVTTNNYDYNVYYIWD